MKTAKLAKSYRIDDGKHFRLKDFDPADTGHLHSEDEAKEHVQKDIDRMQKLQDKLYAQDRWSLLLIFQAMDAAGKDGTIKHVMSGSEPAGLPGLLVQGPVRRPNCTMISYGAPRRLPERGHIGIFNRSYYEEVLVVRVHPKVLEGESFRQRSNEAYLGGTLRRYSQL